MTIPEFEMLCRYWRTTPPAHLAVAAWLGPGRRAPETGGDYTELFRLFGTPGP